MCRVKGVCTKLTSLLTFWERSHVVTCHMSHDIGTQRFALLRFAVGVGATAVVLLFC